MTPSVYWAAAAGLVFFEKLRHNMRGNSGAESGGSFRPSGLCDGDQCVLPPDFQKQMSARL